MPPVEEGRFSTEGSVHLDAVRGAAALVVVLGHTRSLYFSSVASNAPKSDMAATTQIVQSTVTPASTDDVKITIGNEAVMIFFVLSGFLVGGSVIKSLNKRRWSWKDYMAKRLTRLWVVLIPALLLGCLIDHVGIKLFSGQQSIYAAPPRQLIVVGDPALHLGARVWLGNALFTQGVLVENYGVNESLWSLAYEFWYYLLFPMLALAVLARAGVAMRLVWGALAIGVGYFVGIEIMKLFPVWILGAGVAALPTIFSGKMAKRLAMVTAGMMVVALPLVRRAPVGIYTAEWGVAIVAACLIYLIKHLTEQRRHDWYAGVSGFFSRISYTLYLVHLPLAVFACGVLNRPWHVWAKTGTNLSIWIAMNGVLIGASYLFYLAFEANTDVVRKMAMNESKRPRVEA